MKFKEVQVRGQEGIEKRIRVEEQKEFQSLEPRTIKINVNSSCDKCYRNVGLGIIDRDASRRCVQA